MTEKMCHCGRPLHYNDPDQEALVEYFIEQNGEGMVVTVGRRSWLVPRHYVALHGIKGDTVGELGFPEIE